MENEKNSGWFKIPRSIQGEPTDKSAIFKDAYIWQLYSWCRFKAVYTDQLVSLKVGRGYTQIHLQRGQFLFGRNKAAEALDCNPNTLYGRLMRLKDINLIGIQSNKQYSIVTVYNYDVCEQEDFEFQQPIQQTTTKTTTK